MNDTINMLLSAASTTMESAFNAVQPATAATVQRTLDAGGWPELRIAVIDGMPSIKVGVAGTGDQFVVLAHMQPGAESH